MGKHTKAAERGIMGNTSTEELSWTTGSDVRQYVELEKKSSTRHLRKILEAATEKNKSCETIPKLRGQPKQGGGITTDSGPRNSHSATRSNEMATIRCPGVKGTPHQEVK